MHLPRTINIIPARSTGFPSKDLKRLKAWKALDEQDLNGLIKEPYSVILRVKEGDHIRGLAMVRETMIQLLAVDPHHQRKGYGRALVDQMKDVCPELLCGVNMKNQTALAFWKAQGFELCIDLLPFAMKNNILPTFIWKKKTKSQFIGFRWARALSPMTWILTLLLALCVVYNYGWYQ